MKTPLDPRHKRRQEIVQVLFASSFTDQHSNDQTIKEILQNLTSIDSKISSIAPEYPIDKINRIDLAILRLATYEISYSKKNPEKVVIDEAIELAKEFGGEKSPAFINGALGKLVQLEHEQNTTISK